MDNFIKLLDLFNVFCIFCSTYTAKNKNTKKRFFTWRKVNAFSVTECNTFCKKRFFLKNFLNVTFKNRRRNYFQKFDFKCCIYNTSN